MSDELISLEMSLPSGGAVRLGDVVDLDPEVGDPVGEKHAVVVRMLPEYQQVALMTMSGNRLTVDLDEISIPPWDIPLQDSLVGEIGGGNLVVPSVPLPSREVVTVGDVVVLAPEASAPECGHMAVVETVERGGFTVRTSHGCRLSVYPYEVRVPDWDVPADCR
jgi:hypothetical protein